MDKREQKNGILNNIYSQIAAFDKKASILIAVVSIASAVFLPLVGILGIFGLFNYNPASAIIKTWLPILIVVLCCISFLAITSFVLAIVPRKKLGQAIYANYYKDISRMNFDEYEAYFKVFTENDDLLTNQIIVNSVIASKKHFWLKIGTWLLPVYGFITVAIVAILVCFSL